MKFPALIGSVTSLAALLVGGCADAARAEEECKISVAEAAKFLPRNGQTAPPSNGLPIPPVENDCAFYKWAWQSFLYVTEQKQDKRPAFLSYPTIERAFPKVFSKPNANPAVAKETSQMLTLSVRNIEPVLSSRAKWNLAITPEQLGDAAPVLNDGVMQASQGGAGAVLVDQNHNPVFYTIHVNQVFADFVQANELDDIVRLLADPSIKEDAGKNPVPADLEFRPGAMEFKSSWMILDGPPSRYPNYITTRAKIPVLKNEPNKNAPGTHLAVDASKPLREVNVALLGLHVVGVIDGHPEFIWASFEHANDKTGVRDVAPVAHDNPAPSNTPPQTIDGSSKDYPLFKANTPVGKANIVTTQPVGANQKFADATPAFRVFPGSASSSAIEDPAITALNQQMTKLFVTNDPQGKDWRRHYRLLGAVWLNQPRKDDFKEGLVFGDDDVKLAGENRLSNISIESFTQVGAPHCFSCHNTDVQDQDLGGKVLPARRINVSHIFTIVAKKYLSSIK